MIRRISYSLVCTRTYTTCTPPKDPNSNQNPKDEKKNTPSFDNYGIRAARKNSVTIVAALSCFLLAASSTSAQNLISETFDGDTENPVVLHGKTPTFLDPAFTGATWSSDTDFFRDGSMTGGTATGKGIIDVGNFINDQKGDADAIFTVSLTADVTKNWLSVGFFDSDASVTQNGVNDTPGSTLFRGDDSDTADVYITGEGVWSDNFTGSSHPGEQTFSVTIDLTEWNGTDTFGSAIFTMAGSTSSVYTYGSDRDFRFVGFSTASNSNGQLSNFEFTQIPEPGTFALLAGLTGLGWVMLRRRRLC